MRVLEVGGGVAASYCARLLGRWGADTIKVELPSEATTGRRHVQEADDEWLDRYLNGGKQRVTLDYWNTDGRALLDRLAARCDVFLTDHTPAEIDELGLLALGTNERPSVRTSITPFGLSGPYRDYQATPATLLALGGQTFLMGDEGSAPLTMPGHYPEYQAGLFAYSATVATLLNTNARPAGSRLVEVSVFEAMVALHQSTTVRYTYGGRVRSRHGNRFGDASHPLTILPCKHGWFGMCISGENFWEPFTMLLGRPELATDPRFETSAARSEHADELDAIIIESVADRTNDELLVEGQETCRVPVATVANLHEMLDDRHLAERGFWHEVEQADGTTPRYPGTPFRFVGDELPQERPVAQPGEHNEAVYTTLLGVEAGEFSKLEARGLI